MSVSNDFVFTVNQQLKTGCLQSVKSFWIASVAHVKYASLLTHNINTFMKTSARIESIPFLPCVIFPLQLLLYRQAGGTCLASRLHQDEYACVCVFICMFVWEREKNVCTHVFICVTWIPTGLTLVYSMGVQTRLCVCVTENTNMASDRFLCSSASD